MSIDIPAAEWRLSVTGLVDSPLELTLEDVQALPNTTVSSFLECSGNSRSRFGTDVEGTQWGNTAIGNAEWTGVTLAAVLDLAGVQEGDELSAIGYRLLAVGRLPVPSPLPPHPWGQIARADVQSVACRAMRRAG